MCRTKLLHNMSGLLSSFGAYYTVIIQSLIAFSFLTIYPSSS